MIVAYSLSNIYDHSLGSMIAYVKWASSLFVGILTYSALHRYKVQGSSWRAVLAYTCMIVAFFLSNLGSSDVVASSEYLLVLFAFLFISFQLAKYTAVYVINSGYFDLVVYVGKLVILTNFMLYMIGINLGRGYSDRFSGWTDNPNTLAMLIAPTVIMLFVDSFIMAKKGNVVRLAFLFAGIFLLVKTGSRAGLLWVIIALFGYVIVRQTSAWLFMASIAALMIILVIGEDIYDLLYATMSRDNYRAGGDILTGRSEVWPFGLSYFYQKPLLGYGLGSSEKIIGGHDFDIHVGLHFHSSYLTAAVEVGAIGLFSMIVCFLTTILRSYYYFSSNGFYKQGDSRYIIVAFMIFFGALFNAIFESWLLSPGNVNFILFWVCFFVLQLKLKKTGFKNSQLKIPEHVD